MITVGDIVSIASILKVGQSLGASLAEIKAELPAITKQALDINAEITKLSTMPQLSQTLTIDLSVARDKVPQDVTGAQIQAMDITGDLYVRFNQADSESYNLNKVRRLNIPFDKIFLTNVAQPGASATLVFGSSLFQIQDVSPMEINIIASEVTLAISIESSTIMMPIDIQSSYVMVPIDIQAQYMNLAIDIVAQTIGSIAINIAGQIQNVEITVDAQNVGVALTGDWAAKKGTDKNFIGYATNQARGSYVNATYTVTTGKTLFISAITGSCCAYNEADADLPQICLLVLLSQGSAVDHIGGNGGAGISFPKPFAIPSGGLFEIRCYNETNHVCDLRVTANGWEE